MLDISTLWQESQIWLIFHFIINYKNHWIISHGNSPKNAQGRDPVNRMKTETREGLQGFLTFHKQLEIQQSHKTSFSVPVGSGERGLNKITTLPRKKGEHKPIFLLT